MRETTDKGMADIESGLERGLRDAGVCRALLARLEDALGGRPLTFMEVCGTHTVSIFHSGLRSLLPAGVTHLSGPGCPVCVTHDAEVALYLSLVGQSGDIILATFGDLLRVPGPGGRTLKHAIAEGARVEIVYSPLDALETARANPGKTVVFLGVGFETTAPTSAAAVLRARAEKLDNFCLLSLHKLVPPALMSLVSSPDNRIDAFLLPGHVATVTGLAPFAFLAERGLPSAVAGFEPAEILLGLCSLAEQRSRGQARVENAYQRAVDNGGNPRARQLMEQVFMPADAMWRGLGAIPASGLAMRPEYAAHDAWARLGLALPDVKPLPGCRCGEVLKGRISPPDCPLFGTACTPAKPAGPCMVSTEGSCAAHYRYRG